MNCIFIDLDGYITQVHQIHISKNLLINLTLMCLTKTLQLYHGLQNEILRGCFGMFQNC